MEFEGFVAVAIPRERPVVLLIGFIIPQVRLVVEVPLSLN